MQPKRMAELLRDLGAARTLQSRRTQENGRVWIELTAQDVELLHRLGIEVDSLGPRLVVLMWDEAGPLEIGGYLVVDNVAMGLPSLGGIRLAPDITPAAIHNLARGMTMKNAAADLPFGGGKSGILARGDLSPAEHTEVVRGFARLLRRYTRLYNPGPDVGTNDQDMKTIAIENGLDAAVSKPADMGGNRIDQLGSAAGGVVIALEQLHREIERLRVLPQFRNLRAPPWDEVTLIIQGFGAVGANVGRLLWERSGSAASGSAGSGPRVLGISDVSGYLYCASGLDVGRMLALRDKGPIIARPYFLSHPDDAAAGDTPCADLKFGSDRDDLLRESAFCLVPAAPQANYLDLDGASHPSITVDKMGRWAMIVEGANTYSPDPRRKAARRRMERVVYHERGTLIATDFLVNSGGVIFAAHEKMIRTPDHLRIPGDLLGDRAAVERWLADHAADLAALSEKRRAAAEIKRDSVIRENMIQLVDGLLADDDALPCQVAETISIGRIVRQESHRVASEIMADMPTTTLGCSVQQAAQTLVAQNTDILAVIAPEGQVVGIVTDWDITKAASANRIAGAQVQEIMSSEVISCGPGDSVLEIVRKLEQHDISALPVLSPDGKLLGGITTQLLATRTLYRLLLGEQPV